MAIMNFNYNQAISQAGQIEAVASEMLTVANRQLQNTLDSIGVCWRGETASQFLRSCATTQEDVRAQAKKLQELASRIREVARIIKEAEERALEIQRQQEAAARRAAEAARSASASGSGGGGGR